MLCFFSSRRRHTRSKRDWSSDVCSSDLHRHEGGLDGRPRRAVPAPGSAVGGGQGQAQGVGIQPLRWRSEERRVGKECRYWLETEKDQKKIALYEIQAIRTTIMESTVLLI